MVYLNALVTYALVTQRAFVGVSGCAGVFLAGVFGSPTRRSPTQRGRNEALKSSLCPLAVAVGLVVHWLKLLTTALPK